MFARHGAQGGKGGVVSDTAMLVLPCAALKESYLSALDDGMGDIAKGKSREGVEAGFESHLEELSDDGTGDFTEGGVRFNKVPAQVYWLADQGRFIGSCQIRSTVNGVLLAAYGGHVGYRIRESERGKGYGRKILGLALRVCKGSGINPVVVSCDATNARSRAVIVANGGVLVRRVAVPSETGDDGLEVYEINLLKDAFETYCAVLRGGV